MKHRPFLELEAAVLRPVDVGAGEVGGQEVRRELDALVGEVDGVGQRLDGLGLGKARRALHQQVTIREHRDQQQLDEGRLPEDAGIHIDGEVVEGAGEAGAVDHRLARAGG